MNNRRPWIWLLVMVWMVSSATPSFAVCTCRHASGQSADRCCMATPPPTTPKDAPASCCKDKDAPPARHSCESGKHPCEDDSPAAVMHHGCHVADHVHTALLPAPVKDPYGIALVPATTPQGPAIDTGPTAPPPPAAPAHGGDSRLVTNVYRL